MQVFRFKRVFLGLLLSVAASAAHAGMFGSIAADAPRGTSVAPGQAAQLHEALARGGTVHLEAGLYVLDSDLYLPAQVELIGAGHELTTIRIAGLSEDAFAAVFVESEGTVTLRDMTIEYAGQADARVIYVDTGHLDAQGILVQGGRGEQGAGIQLAWSSTGVIQDSMVTGNTRYGVTLTGDSHVEIRNSAVVDNGESGVLLNHDSTALVRGSEISNNGHFGLEAYGQGSVEIVSSRFIGNAWEGVALSQTSQGTIMDNLFEDGHENGLILRDQAHAVVRFNTFRNNAHSGMITIGQATGVIENNLSTGNGYHGFFAGDQSGPIVRNNTFSNNNWMGFSVDHDATGEFSGNTNEGNGESGFYCGTGGAARLSDNLAAGNIRFGYLRTQGAGCVESGTLFKDNLEGERATLE